MAAAEEQIKKNQELMEETELLSIELEKVKAQNKELQKTLGTISESKSWKLTAPVRHMLDKLKK